MAYEWTSLENWLDDQTSSDLLLGNGASIAYGLDTSYPRLLERSGLAKEKVLRDLLDYLGPAVRVDLENLDFLLGAARVVAESIDREALKHPDLEGNPSRIDLFRGTMRWILHTQLASENREVIQGSEGRRARAADAMARFSSVFSLNYDAVAYWAHLELVLNRNESRGDAFAGKKLDGLVPYRRPGKWPVLWHLHGAMHIVERWSDKATFKLASTKEETLLDRLDFLEEEFSPLVVFEGQSAAKARAIQQSEYLRTAFVALGQSAPSVFVYGWAMGDQDRHVLETLAASPSLRDMLIGVHGGGSWPSIAGSLARFEARREDLGHPPVTIELLNTRTWSWV